MQFKLNRIFFAFILALFISCNRDDCKDITCLYGTLYQEPYKECKCVCNEGWYGTNCEKMTEAKIASNILAKFVGTWNANISNNCYGFNQVCEGKDTSYKTMVTIDTVGIKASIYGRTLEYDTIIDNTLIYGYVSSYHNHQTIFKINDVTGEFSFLTQSGGLAATFSTYIKGKR